MKWFILYKKTIIIDVSRETYKNKDNVNNFKNINKIVYKII